MEKVMYVVDKDLLDSMREDLSTVKRSLQSMKVVEAKTDGYLTSEAWMDAVKVSRWKFDQLKALGLLKTIRRGRKYYIPESEVQRYFEGHMEIKN